MSLPPEVEASYATIIDSILAASDLNTISEKRIRKGLQASVQYDITPQKGLIKKLILARFDKFNAGNSSPTKSFDSPQPTVETNRSDSIENFAAKTEPGLVKEEDNSSAPVVICHDLKEEQETPRRKLKQQPSTSNSPIPTTDKDSKKKRKLESLDDDARLAARLQAEENGRARPTRGGTHRKATPSKKQRVKSKVKVKDSDQEDGSDPDEKKRKVTRTGGFHLSRPETVKRIWQYVKERDLQDPCDKRNIRCDDAMRAVFKQDKVHMFTMNKILSQHLYAMDE
ncbi:MAG: hypothetical protein M1829_006185 [Trizodia sp. TS-e1964]|nr:MAG: hypothetical protein M1829_006185 [Trizodia sp. TS-e1964]